MFKPIGEPSYFWSYGYWDSDEKGGDHSFILLYPRGSMPRHIEKPLDIETPTCFSEVSESSGGDHSSTGAVGPLPEA